MTGMQRLMEELRRHADQFERAAEPEEKRRALRRFRVAFLLGNQSLGLRESDSVESEQWSEPALVPFGTSEGNPTDRPSVVVLAVSEQETETRTTSHTVTRTGPDGGSSHSVGRSVSVGGCRHCAHRAREVEGRSTTRTVGVAQFHGESITESRSVSTAPPEPQTKGESAMSADGHDCDSVTE